MVTQEVTKLDRITADVAEFVGTISYRDVPAEAIELAKQAILDTVGVAVAGTRTPDAGIAIEWVRRQGAAPTAAVMGADLRTSPSLAAFANALLAHALDYDDINHPAYAHPSSVVLPAVLGIAEPAGQSGRDVLLAFSVGFDIEARLGAVLNPSHYRRGWHATGTLGTVAATVAACKALRLDPGAIAMAIGVAVSASAGVKQNLGTMGKPYHAAHAAWAGVGAGQLAELGFVTDPHGLEGRAGFFEMFRGAQEPVPELMTRDLGTHWHITDLPAGWSPKPFPSCGGTHTTIQAVDALRRQYGVRPEDVRGIEIGINEMSVETLVRHNPQTGQEGKYSLEFCAAVTLVHGLPGIRDFSDERVREPLIRELISKVSISSPPEVAHDSQHAAIVSISTTDGRVVSHRENLGRGKPGNPLTRAERLAKFEDCTQGILDGSARGEAIELIERLDELEDLSSLTKLLVPDPAVTA